MWFAKADGRDGTFLLSNPDFTAFKLPLAKSAAAVALAERDARSPSA